MKSFFYMIFAVILLSACDTETGDQEVADDQAKVAGEQAKVAGEGKLSEDDLNKKLLDGARKGDLDAVKKVLEQGADVNTVNNSGATALMLAVENNQKDVVELLLGNANTNIFIADNKGDTVHDYVIRLDNDKYGFLQKITIAEANAPEEETEDSYIIE